MKRKIEKGITIIYTAEDHIGVRNKQGYPGISRYNNTDKWRAEISSGSKKYIVGIFDNLNDAIKARKIAESKKEAGMLATWLLMKPHGKSIACMAFWENEFKRMDGK